MPTSFSDLFFNETSSKPEAATKAAALPTGQQANVLQISFGNRDAGHLPDGN
jgi:hypothetical protein